MCLVIFTVPAYMHIRREQTEKNLVQGALKQGSQGRSQIYNIQTFRLMRTIILSVSVKITNMTISSGTDIGTQA